MSNNNVHKMIFFQLPGIFNLIACERDKIVVS